MCVFEDLFSKQAIQAMLNVWNIRELEFRFVFVTKHDFIAMIMAIVFLTLPIVNITHIAMCH